MPEGVFGRSDAEIDLLVRGCGRGSQLSDSATSAR